MPGSPEQWYAFARDAIMLVIGVLVFYWGRDRKQTADAIDAHFEALSKQFEAKFSLYDAALLLRDERVQRLEQRFEEASRRYSDLSSAVQTLIGRIDRLPDELRSKFLSLDRANDQFEQANKDRAAMWVAIHRGGRGMDRERLTTEKGDKS